MFCFLLAACSSPPEPTPVDFEKGKSVVINNTLPTIPVSTQAVIRSETSEKAWTYSATFMWSETAYSPQFYYAIAHADYVVVKAPDAQTWFTVRDWLKNNGMRGVVYFQKKSCFSCDSIEITFNKGGR